MDIRSRIRKCLDDRPDLSPRSLSLKAGLSDSMMHKFLTEQTRSMTVDNLEKVAVVLEVDTRWLIFGDEPEAADPLSAENVYRIWDRISVDQRRQALRILETFAADSRGE